MPRTRSIITASFLLLCISTIAQIPSPLIFSRITKKEGLASNTVLQTTRDKEGYLWIATQNGLQRYDGNRFLTFRHIPGNASSIATNSVNHIFIDRKQRCWLLFDKQTGLFNTTRFSFTETKITAPVNMLKKIMEDEAGRIILFADSKQLVFDEQQQSFIPNKNIVSFPAGYTISDMAIDVAGGSYWLTGKQGSLLYDIKTKEFDSGLQSKGGLTARDSLLHVKNARYPFIAKDGSWWMVNWVPFTAEPPMVYHFDKKENKLYSFERIRAYTANSYYEIWGIFQQSNGTIWIYGMGLLAYYSPQEKRFIHISSNPFEQNAIDYDFVSSLYEDHEKNIWVSSNKGLYRFNIDAQVFSNMPNRRFNDTTVIHNAVSTILQTKNNGIWISTWGAGVFSYNNQLQPVANPVTTIDPANKTLHTGCMIQRRNSEIWMGLNTGEIKIYEPGTGKCFTTTLTTLKGEVIQQLREDSDGNTWIGTNSGLLLKCVNGNWRDSSSFKTILTAIGDIMRIYEDSTQHIWICSAATGVYQLDKNGKILKQFKEGPENNKGLLKDGATDIVQYNDSIYLIASDGLCILNSKTNTFKYLTAADGLPAENITSILPDKQKRIWVTLDGGLYKLNIHNKLHVTFNEADGITNNIFQVSGGTVLNDGRIMLGTPKDFMVFDPEKTIDTAQPPLVHITGIKSGSSYLSTDSILKLGKLELAYDNTFVIIELSTLHFRDNYSIHYMLEGLDKTWKPADNNQVIYQYLPPGTYKLLLRSENGEVLESKNITSLEIKINPPFWKTGWFYGLLALFTGGLLFWFDQQRMKRKEAMLNMRSNIADGLHQDISAALGNITILSEMAKMKADAEPEKSKEFIEQIHMKSQGMTNAMDDILWSIDPNNDSMEHFILRFREYADALKSQYITEIDVLVDKNIQQLQLNMKMRSDIFWLFKNGITNVIRTGGRNCRIHISYKKPFLNYILEFDTAGMDIKQINNLRQRQELSDRLDTLGAKLDFKEHHAMAAFELNIPIRKTGL